MSKKQNKKISKTVLPGKSFADVDTDAVKPAEKPISLAPLKFEEAVEDLLQVRPVPKGG